MFLETVKSEGLAHLSYIVGDSGHAAVIDPRLDCSIYTDIAKRNGSGITHIFETHRNEDYVTGSRELAKITGADIYHGKHLPFTYGNPVAENDIFKIGEIRLRVLETPGHTYESISLVMTDESSGKKPLAVFTGDALFIGSTGRTDFFPEQRKTAGLLYESIFNKILPLGDGVMLFPAHGTGSVCGKDMASRDFSTIGFEKEYNAGLKVKAKEEFINLKLREQHYLPPYFKEMERLNLARRQLRHKPPEPWPLESRAFAEFVDNMDRLLDIRSPEAFAGAYIPGSLAIPLHLLPSFAGWFLDYKQPVCLIADNLRDIETAVIYLFRIGYNKIPAYLSGGLSYWETSGKRYDRIPAIHAEEIVRRIKEREDFTILDVREISEYQEGHLPGSKHIFLGELPRRINEVDKNKPVTTFCGSGQRAIIAASILKRKGFSGVETCLGSMAACQAIGCPIKTRVK